MLDTEFERLGERAAPDARKTFAGLMERAWSEDYGWMVSFDGRTFFTVSCPARLSNVAQMLREIADEMPWCTREYFEQGGGEIVTVCSSRRGT